MCIDGVGHDQTCKPERGCIFSPKYATRDFFQQTCKAAFGVDKEVTDAAVWFNSATYGDNNPSGGSRIAFINGNIDPFHAGGQSCVWCRRQSGAVRHGAVRVWRKGHCRTQSS